MTPDENPPTEGRRKPPRVAASDDPELIGSELRDVEAVLRNALSDQAEQITPSHRLDAILAASHAEAATPRGQRRWWLPVAAAAAAAVVVGGALVVNHQQTTSPPVVAGPTSTTPLGAPSSELTSPSTLPTNTGPSNVPTQSASPAVPVAPPTVSTTTSTAPSPSPSPSPTVSSAPTPTTAAPAPTPVADVSTVPVPVYYVGTRLGHDVLFREFVGIDLPTPVSKTATAEAAVRTAMGSVPKGSGYRAAWAGVDLVGAEVSKDGIRLRLARGLTGVPTDRGKVAVQQLVWTAQAAVGEGPVPVSFTLADGGRSVAPGQPASGQYNRPTDPAQVFALLSPLWIDSPTRGQVVKAGRALTATGMASTNEANVVWQLMQGEKVVRSASVTAARAAPDRGAFSIALGPLGAGDYVVRVLEESASDGSVSAEQRMPFTVE